MSDLNTQHFEPALRTVDADLGFSSWPDSEDICFCRGDVALVMLYQLGKRAQGMSHFFRQWEQISRGKEILTFVLVRPL